MSELTMRNNFVLVKLSEGEKENFEKKGALYTLKQTADNKQYESGTVLAVGEKVNSTGISNDVSNPIHVGDTILFDRYAARPYRDDLAIVPEDKVVAIVS
jgi:co-chaperonin GroES (HSP10)